MSGYFKNHISLEVNSRERTRGDIENFDLFLEHQLKFSQKESKSYYLRIENIQIPKSYYDIDSNFNVFQVIETDGVTPHTLTITIDVGNYTITELLTELESALDSASSSSGDSNTYTLSYDDITNKVTIRYDGGTSTSVTIDTIANGSTLNQLIGFGKEDTTTITGQDNTTVLSDGVDSTAPNCVDLHTKSYIVLETSITSNNYYNKDRQLHVGARVPMLVDRNEVQYFSNHEGHKTLINNKGPISTIGFRLLDEYGNQIDLCEVDWSCEVNFYELTERNKATHDAILPPRRRS